ncbi:MAG: GNAT family N-acetyltransferase [Pseudomonadota bacterium]
MDLTFESDRLTYRPIQLDDLDLAVALWADPDVVTYLADRTYTREELALEMPLVTRRAGDGCIGVWVIADKATDERHGEVFLLPMPIDLDDTDWNLLDGGDIPNGPIEIGYVLRKTSWGRGYATEACRRLTQFAFEVSPLQEIWAVTDPANDASKNVLRKSGYKDEPLVKAYQAQLPGFRAFRAQWLAENTM